eukprot:1451119-Prymnesium_polylepis.1
MVVGRRRPLERDVNLLKGGLGRGLLEEKLVAVGQVVEDDRGVDRLRFVFLLLDVALLLDETVGDAGAAGRGEGALRNQDAHEWDEQLARTNSIRLRAHLLDQRGLLQLRHVRAGVARHTACASALRGVVDSVGKWQLTANSAR